jgi:hypothetical protein
MAALIGAPNSYVLSSTTATQGKDFGLGARAEDQNGAVWVYVQAASVIAQYDTVFFDEGYSAASITRALADDAGQVGFAQQAFATGDRGFVGLSNGSFTVRAAASSLANTVLWTSDTAGILTTTAASASHLPILGVVAAGAASAGGVTNITAFAAYPVVRGTNV